MRDEDDVPLAQDGTPFQIGEDLYGLSVHELQARIEAYGAEIERLSRELEKKSAERSAADALFAPKSS